MIGTKAEEKPRYRIKRPLSERILHVFNLVFLVVIAFTMVYPFWEIFVTSFMTDQEINSQYFCVWPKTFRWEAYRRIFTDPVYDFGGAFFNSVIVTAATTVYQLAITAMTAYALTRKTLPGKKIFFFFFIITMYFSGGMIPYYIVVTGLGLSDTLAVMIIPSFMSVFNMLVMRAFFQELPSSLEEAATIDGASYFRVFWSIVLPLSKAVLATIALFIAVGKWNDWYTAMLFIQRPDIRPLAYALQKIMEKAGGNSTGTGVNIEIIGESVRSAAIVVAVFPIMIIYPFFQKHFVKGVLIGSIKG